MITFHTRLIIITAFFFLTCEWSLKAQRIAKQINVIVIGAHPDDCDMDAGGTALLFSSMGHKVKFLSLTNGDAGHQIQGGGQLARRRADEAEEAGKRFGVEYEVLNNHDGELEPKLSIRLEIIRRIREWKADIVIAPRPNDYHPDHRYTGILVQDAAYMVGVPNILPDCPPLKKNPVFLYAQDNFKRPNPFRPDIAIDITAVFEKKIHAMDAHQSQFYEWLPWIGGYAKEVPADFLERKKWLAKRYQVKFNPEQIAALEKFYGKQSVLMIRQAEFFEICEYGAQPDEAAVRKLFPMIKMD